MLIMGLQHSKKFLQPEASFSWSSRTHSRNEYAKSIKNYFSRCHCCFLSNGHHPYSQQLYELSLICAYLQINCLQNFWIVWKTKNFSLQIYLQNLSEFKLLDSHKIYLAFSTLLIWASVMSLLTKSEPDIQIDKPGIFGDYFWI